MCGDELEWVRWLSGKNSGGSPVRVGIGDDMAVVEPPRGAMLVSSDMLLDGVHFDDSEHKPEQIGRKAIACSLSDCAAMAVRPLTATVSLALPEEWSLDKAKQLYEGMRSMADAFTLALVGGDTTRWRHPLAIDVAITAEPYENVTVVTRSGAKVGDRIFVTGRLGGSLLGRHMNFTPRVREARQIAEALGDRLHAMIDISDGLSLDLWRLCEASRVGAVIEEEQLLAVVHEDAVRAAERDGRAPLDHALGDGEDFELLLAASGDVTQDAGPLLEIGRITAETIVLERRDGRRDLLEPRGFTH